MTTALSTQASTPAPTPRWIVKVATSSKTSARRAFWLSFVAFFAVSGLWALSNPLMASVDEPAHTIKAAATVLGAPDTSADGSTTGIGTVEVPRLYSQLALYPNCFAFKSDTTAACQPDLSGDLESLTPTVTSAINYNPLYYAAVGLPALLPGGGEHTVYLMRLVNALLASAVLALAVRTVAEMPRRRWLALGVLLPLTPTFVNLTGSVNPQSIEVTGALLLWVALLAALRAPDPGLLDRRMFRMVLGALLVSNSRGLGPLFVVLIVLVALAASRWSDVVALVRNRRSWWAIALSILACAVATAWILGADALPVGPGTGIPFNDAVYFTLGNTSAYLQQLISALGWLDVGVPIWLYMMMMSLVALVVLLGWSMGSRRDRLVVLGTAVLVFVIPVAIQAVQAASIGYFWQGRYIFPLAIGLVVLACFAVRHRAEALPGWLSVNLITTTASLFAIGNVVAFGINLHRYVNGADGGWFSTDANSWVPLLPPLVLVLLYAMAWAFLTAVVLRSTNFPPEVAEASASGDEHAPALGSEEGADHVGDDRSPVPPLTTAL